VKQYGGEPACFNLPVETTVTAYLGFGSNVGDRARNLADALGRVARIVNVQQASSIYETEPVGFKDQPPFWNMVVRIATDLPAVELLRALIAIEADMGRQRTFRNAPRNIDIDVLLYDDVVLSGTELALPHPRMHERAFVLRPLLEIAPDAADPRSGRRYAEILGGATLERAEIVAPPLLSDQG